MIIPPDLIDGGVQLDQVDTDDGDKIVSNIFGPNSDQVAHTLGGALGGSQSGGQGDLIKRLLPILAPIVLSYLTKRMGGGGKSGGGGLLGCDPGRRRRRLGLEPADRHPRPVARRRSK